MRSKYHQILALATAFFLLLAGASAGQSATLISLDQAIDLALAHNHALLAQRTLINQDQALEITANLRPNPTLGGDAQFIPVFQPNNFSEDYLNESQQFDLGLGYLFERGGKRQRRLQAAKDQTAVTRSQVADAERTLAFNVGQQFVSVLLAESTLQFAEQDLEELPADGGHRRGAIQSRRHQRRRLSQDLAAVAAVPDRCILGAPGASAGPGQPARTARE